MITAAAPRVRDYLSYSAVRTFQGCPLKYRFRYVDGLTEDCVSSALVFGSAIHAAVEFFYSQQLAGEAAPDLRTLLKIYECSWNERSREQIRFGSQETPESLNALAARMLHTFLKSELRIPEGRIIGVEEELRGQLSPDLPGVLGRIDLILETEDAVIVQDFKTSRSLWAHEHAYEQAEQLLLYASLARHLVPGKPLRLQFTVLTKTKTPQLQRVEATFDEQRLKRTTRVLQTVWQAIQAGHFYPAPSPIQCSGCGYRKQCEAWSGNPPPGDNDA